MHSAAPPFGAHQPISSAALLQPNPLQAHMQLPAAVWPILAPRLSLVPPLGAAGANHRVGYTGPRPVSLRSDGGRAAHGTCPYGAPFLRHCIVSEKQQ